MAFLQVLSTLSTLETLDLEDNLLGSAPPEGAFPAGIAGLSRLQWLNMARCELQHVPNLVERLSALRILDLTNNRQAYSVCVWTHSSHSCMQAGLCWLLLHAILGNGIGVACHRLLQSDAKFCILWYNMNAACRTRLQSVRMIG